VEVNKEVYGGIVTVANMINLPRWIWILTVLIWDSYLKELYPFDHVPLVTLYGAISEPLIRVIVWAILAIIGVLAYLTFF